MVPHLAYELRMMLLAAHFINNPVLDRRDARQFATHNALLESWTIHTRSLCDFLFLKGEKDDCNAVDFVPHWLDGRTRPATLTDARIRANKEIAHLTYNRLRHETEQDRHWEIENITDEVFEHFSTWLALSPKYVQTGIADTLRLIRHLRTQR